MSRPVTIVLAVLVLLAGAWLLRSAAASVYLDRRAELAGEIEESQHDLASWQQQLESETTLRRKIDAIVDRTLGGDLETVDHRLRTRLNRLAEDAQITGASVTTGRAVARQSPARSQMSRRGPWAELRDEIDFVELEGSITAAGSFEQIITLIDSIEAEAWIKRIESLVLNPNRNGKRCSATIRLRTIFVPGREPEAGVNRAPRPSRLPRYAVLIEKNPFLIPTKEEASEPPAPPVAPVFDPSQWVITGIVASGSVGEVWIRHRETGEQHVLRAGESHESVRLEDVAGDAAVLIVDQTRMSVRVGDSLTEGERIAP